MASPLRCSLVCIVLFPLTAWTITVGTYNAQLFVSAPAYQERKDALIQQLSTDDNLPDVLCLQEVFAASDQKELVKSANNSYRHSATSYNLLSPPSPQPACNATAISKYSDCFIPNCVSNSTIRADGRLALLHCGQTLCREFYTVLSESCIACVSIHFTALQDPFTHCVSQVPHGEYEFPNGLMLLSKYQIKDLKIVNYIEKDTQIKEAVRRAYISATVKKKHVVCTHLTAIAPAEAPYTGPEIYSNTEEQQLDEVYHLLELVEQHVNMINILLGDFNHGPAVHNTTWTAPFNYGLMNARGLISVNSVWCAQCTFCKDNPLTNGQDNLIIDHIYIPVTWLSRVVQVTMLFDTERTTSGQHLSDHFGVKAKIRNRRNFQLRRVCNGSPFQGQILPFSDMNDQEEQLSKICTNTG